jgi:arylsulfatase A-like enzyme
MMTGKFTYKNGFQNYVLQVEDEIGLPLSNKLVPAYMNELGYRTVMYGKWNIGHCNAKYLPHQRGFDHFVGYMCPGHGYTDYNCGMGSGVKDMLQGSAALNETTQQVEYAWSTGQEHVGTYDTQLYRDLTRAAIQSHATNFAEKGVPLFLWAAHHGIHSELDSDPDPPEEMITAENRVYLAELDRRIEAQETLEEKQFFSVRKVTATVLQSLDNAFIDLVGTLEETGMLSNTIIFVNSDNGGDTVYTKGHPGNNYPLRSLKFGYFEGGVRVPAFVYAPGHIPKARQGTSYNGMMHHVDLLTTFYGLGGGDVASLKANETNLDGDDHWSAIKGDAAGPRNELVLNLPRSKVGLNAYSNDDEGVALRVGKYKLLLNHPYDYWFSPNPGPDHHNATMMMAAECKYDWYGIAIENPDCDFQNFLFDLEADPTERVNLFGHADYLDTQAEMLARADKLLLSTEGDYGDILARIYAKEQNSSDLKSARAAWESYNGFAVPWECDVIL